MNFFAWYIGTLIRVRSGECAFEKGPPRPGRDRRSLASRVWELQGLQSTPSLQPSPAHREEKSEEQGHKQGKETCRFEPNVSILQARTDPFRPNFLQPCRQHQCSR
ncbi:hypothetical protein Nepgr_028972 [Nepenthes gracilis]|uniref:Uncharacterized protein n=1 Tax=Nepenthes gracilis TaxID=150966 RepID=A0AAD3TD70_NEPGR|nr:hypothetical protein Nepgr_028972 [Nepenthes gracilis]